MTDPNLDAAVRMATNNIRNLKDKTLSGIKIFEAAQTYGLSTDEVSTEMKKRAKLARDAKKNLATPKTKSFFGSWRFSQRAIQDDTRRCQDY